MKFRKRIVAIFITIIFLAMYHYCIKEHDSHFRMKSTGKTPKEEKLIYRCCRRVESNNETMHKNILFLKTHKCASSTVQNILMRFGLRHSLNFVLPKKPNNIAYFENFSESLLATRTRTKNGKYNILAHHVRYSKQLKDVLYNDTISVTILREPSSLFESLYNFFRLNSSKRYGKNFTDFLNSLTSHKSYSANMNAIKTRWKIDRNQMSSDLGLPRKFSRDISKIKEFIGEVDKEFDFVMITEYMEASLVLLANLMKWPLHYVTFLPINSRPSKNKFSLNETDAMKLSQFNYADFLLYNHFLEKFKKCMFQYGVDQLLRDVETLIRLNNELKQRCVLKENESGYAKTINYKLKIKDWLCEHSAKTELSFTKELKNVQMERLGKL